MAQKELLDTDTYSFYDTTTDTVSIMNGEATITIQLDEAIELAMNLIAELPDIVRYNNMSEYSMRDIINKAIEMHNIAEQIIPEMEAK